MMASLSSFSIRRTSVGRGPLALYFEHDIIQSLDRDVFLPLATAFAPVPVKIRTVEQTVATSAIPPATTLELQVQRPDRRLG